jgi:hypothetical protein
MQRPGVHENDIRTSPFISIENFTGRWIIGLYSRVIFPRLLDFATRRDDLSELRPTLLADVSGDVLEIGFGMGLNLPHYPSE